MRLPCREPGYHHTSLHTMQIRQSIAITASPTKVTHNVPESFHNTGLATQGCLSQKTPPTRICRALIDVIVLAHARQKHSQPRLPASRFEGHVTHHQNKPSTNSCPSAWRDLDGMLSSHCISYSSLPSAAFEAFRCTPEGSLYCYMIETRFPTMHALSPPNASWLGKKYISLVTLFIQSQSELRTRVRLA